MMDNILKVLLGVLSLAGLLAMLTPSNISVVPDAPVAQESVAVAPPVNEVAPLMPDEPQSDETEDEIAGFGEPMIDGKPTIDDESPQQEQQQQRQNPDNPDEPSSNEDDNGTIDYRQILDKAARGPNESIQRFQPPALTPVEQMAMEN